MNDRQDKRRLRRVAKLICAELTATVEESVIPDNIKRLFIEDAKKHSFIHSDGGLLVNNPDKYKSFRAGQDSAFRILQQSEAKYNSILEVNKELVEALEMMLWASENGESESQRQGKPRLIERHEITRLPPI